MDRLTQCIDGSCWLMRPRWLCWSRRLPVRPHGQAAVLAIPVRHRAHDSPKHADEGRGAAVGEVQCAGLNRLAKRDLHCSVEESSTLLPDSTSAGDDIESEPRVINTCKLPQECLTRMHEIQNNDINFDSETTPHTLLNLGQFESGRLFRRLTYAKPSLNPMAAYTIFVG